MSDAGAVVGVGRGVVRVRRGRAPRPAARRRRSPAARLRAVHSSASADIAAGMILYCLTTTLVPTKYLYLQLLQQSLDTAVVEASVKRHEFKRLSNCRYSTMLVVPS